MSTAAFHGGYWDLAVEELESQGHSVVVLNLQGSREDKDSDCRCYFSGAGERVVEAVKQMGGPWRSWATAWVWVTQAADQVPVLIERLVSVAAFRPGNGDPF